jgi:hypothetical protein
LALSAPLAWPKLNAPAAEPPKSGFGASTAGLGAAGWPNEKAGLGASAGVDAGRPVPPNADVPVPEAEAGALLPNSVEGVVTAASAACAGLGGAAPNANMDEEDDGGSASLAGAPNANAEGAVAAAAAATASARAMTVDAAGLPNGDVVVDASAGRGGWPNENGDGAGLGAGESDVDAFDPAPNSDGLGAAPTSPSAEGLLRPPNGEGFFAPAAPASPPNSEVGAGAAFVSAADPPQRGLALSGIGLAGAPNENALFGGAGASSFFSSPAVLPTPNNGAAMGAAGSSFSFSLASTADLAKKFGTLPEDACVCVSGVGGTTDTLGAGCAKNDDVAGAGVDAGAGAGAGAVAGLAENENGRDAIGGSFSFVASLTGTGTFCSKRIRQLTHRPIARPKEEQEGIKEKDALQASQS